MYLYCDFREQEEVLYYHLGPEYEKISLRPKYENRTQKEGSLKNHTITISNLTVNDSGMYSCDYKKDGGDGIKCNVYMLVVRGMFFFFFFFSLHGSNSQWWRVGTSYPFNSMLQVHFTEKYNTFTPILMSISYCQILHYIYRFSI